MGMIHSVTITLDGACGLEAMEKVLARGFEQGFIYRDIGSVLNTCGSRALSARDAANLLFEDHIVDLGGPVLGVKYQDTAFDLRVYNVENGKLRVDISCFSPKWEKEFRSDDHFVFIDFARYIRLLLWICKDFKVLDISADIS